MGISGRFAGSLPAWFVGLGGLALTLAALALAIAARGVEVPVGMEAGPAPGFLLLWLSFLLPGMLLAIRLPRNPVGWILMTIALVWQVNSIGGLVRVVAIGSGSEVSPAWAAWLWDLLWIPGIALVPLLLLVFPDGKLPSRRWKLAVWLLVAGAVMQFLALGMRPGPFTNTPVMNPLGVSAIEPVVEPLLAVGALTFVLAVVAAAAAPVVRYRSAGLAERYQLKWFLAAVVVVIVAWTFATVLDALGVDAGVLLYIRTVPLVALPVATAVAVLRHRLYDIDLVLNRGLVYASLATLIAGIYLVTVIGIGTLAGLRETGSVLPLAATAVAAIAFQPARQRLQRLANLAVYGQPLRPYDVLSTFTSRMSGAYATGDAPAAMAEAVGKALPVASCDIWLKIDNQLHLAATWPEARSGVQPVCLQRDNPIPVFPETDHLYPVRHEDRLLGAIAIRPKPGTELARAEDRLLSDFAMAAWLVLDNAQLVADLHASRQRLVAAQDTERRRIERDLHDGAQHRLLEVALSLRLAREHTRRHCDPALTESIAAAEAQLRSALAELRDLARGIHPAILTERGLPAALSSLADRAPLPVTVHANGIGRYSQTVESTIYFVAAEALSNVIKHADATSAEIHLLASDRHLELLVSDDGVGGAHELRGVADRVAAVGGRHTITSPIGVGTQLKVEVPCG